MIVVCCGVEAAIKSFTRIGPEKEPLESAAVRVCGKCGRSYETWVRRVVVTDGKVDEETR